MLLMCGTNSWLAATDFPQENSRPWENAENGGFNDRLRRKICFFAAPFREDLLPTTNWRTGARDYRRNRLLRRGANSQ